MSTKTPKEHEEILAADGRDFTCLFRPDAGGYLVTCEEMPPVIAYGETLEDAEPRPRRSSLNGSTPATASATGQVFRADRPSSSVEYAKGGGHRVAPVGVEGKKAPAANYGRMLADSRAIGNCILAFLVIGIVVPT